MTCPDMLPLKASVKAAILAIVEAEQAKLLTFEVRAKALVRTHHI